MSMENGGNGLTVSTIGRMVFKLNARRKGDEQARKGLRGVYLRRPVRSWHLAVPVLVPCAVADRVHVAPQKLGCLAIGQDTRASVFGRHHVLSVAQRG